MYAVYTTVRNRENEIKYPDADMELAKGFIIGNVVSLMLELQESDNSLAGIEAYAREPQRALKAVADYINGCSLVKIIRNKGQRIILTDIIENVCKTMMMLSIVVGNCKIV